MDKSRTDDESVVGDECHIRSSSPNGPRHDPLAPASSADDYDNLILLCKVHHKQVDDQVQSFTAQSLLEAKQKHEAWVSQQLGAPGSQRSRLRRPNKDKALLPPRISDGQELLAVVLNACAYSAGHDKPLSGPEFELVSGFLQELQDWGDLGIDGIADQMNAAKSIDGYLTELEKAGLWVFAYREAATLTGGGGPDQPWPIAHVHVRKSSNPDIVNLAEGRK